MATESARIAIVTTDDRTWALPTWASTIPLLRERHEVVGIYLVPERLGQRTGLRIPLWYVRVFGPLASMILAMYSFVGRLRNKHAASWTKLAADARIALRRGESVNSSDARDWLRDSRVDILFVMVSEILTPETLAIPRIGTINKHAALLPSARGVFPFFWARMAGLPLGVSFHVVDKGIDTGPLLVQERIEDDPSLSMLGFYAEVYSRYPRLARLAADRLAVGELADSPEGLVPSYFSFPARADAKEFARRGYRVARLSDLRRRRR